MCPSHRPVLPLVLACPTCCKSAKIASDLARVMDTEGFAEQVKAITLINTDADWIKQIRAGRAIMLIDGCDACCMQRLLSSHHVHENWHVNLHDFGFDHNLDGLRSLTQLNALLREVQSLLASVKV